MRTLLASLCLIFAVASLNASEVAAGPSNDCEKASTPTEFAICASNDLSALDRELAATYKAAKVNVEVAKGSKAATKLRDEQRQWNKERSSKCGDDVECLSETYQKRILELGSAAGPSPESEWAFFNESVNKITFHLDKITGLTKECIRFFPADYKVDSLGGKLLTLFIPSRLKSFIRRSSTGFASVPTKSNWLSLLSGIRGTRAFSAPSSP